MGVFNRLKTTILCPECQAPVEVTLQFKFGELWMHDYRIGDPLKWGRNRKTDEGRPGLGRVAVDAVVEEAPHCDDVDEQDFIIYVEDDVITRVEPNIGKYDFGAAGNTFISLDPKGPSGQK